MDHLGGGKCPPDREGRHAGGAHLGTDHGLPDSAGRPGVGVNPLGDEGEVG